MAVRSSASVSVLAFVSSICFPAQARRRSGSYPPCERWTCRPAQRTWLECPIRWPPPVRGGLHCERPSHRYPQEPPSRVTRLPSRRRICWCTCARGPASRHNWRRSLLGTPVFISRSEETDTGILFLRCRCVCHIGSTCQLLVSFTDAHSRLWARFPGRSGNIPSLGIAFEQWSTSCVAIIPMPA